LLTFFTIILQEELLFSKKKREDKKKNKNKLKSRLNDEDIPDLADLLGKPIRRFLEILTGVGRGGGL